MINQELCVSVHEELIMLNIITVSKEASGVGNAVVASGIELGENYN